MLGNIREWCLDYLEPYPQDTAVNPVGPSSGTSRCYRGGGYSDAAYICRAGNRGHASPKEQWPQLGFRLAMDILPESEKVDDKEVE